jgi:multidrug efflux system membrane fusion protein
MRSRLTHELAVLSLGLFVTVAGCNEEPPPPTPEAPKVSVLHPEKRQLVDNAEFNGWVAADQSVEVRSRVRGHIQKIHFTDGQIVKKGDLLFELDPRPYEALIGRQKDQLKVYEAQKVAADKDEARLRELQKKGGASVQQVEKAEADAKALEAQIGASKNEIKRAELDLEYSRITADIGGRISKAELTEGNLVNAGGTDPLLTTIRSIDPILVYFNVDERLLQRYAKDVGAAGKKFTDVLAGMKEAKIDFTFAQDGETEFAHKGTLSFGDNRIDPATGTIQVYGTLANADGRYVPGARVRVRLPIGKPYAALLVPETAILADQDKRYVLIADEKNTVRRRNVTLGTLTDDSLRAVRPADKLPEGEKPDEWWVIVDNLQRARLNYPVDPQKPALVTSSEQ